jgi:putative ABC transport system ATP-binding protein
MRVLDAKNIHKTYQDGQADVTVLSGVSLALSRGELICLEGPSGSGKTTLLSILGCILTPTLGELDIDGTAVDLTNPHCLPEVRRRSIGFCFQQFHLFPSLTALENVEYSLKIRGFERRAAVAEARRVLTRVGLGERLSFRPADLSGGQKQRVALARALAGHPAVILADEPTANLDSQSAEQVLHIFRECAREQGSGLIVVTHDPRVRSVADRTVRLISGQLAA